MARSLPNIIVTGTPGTGKTTHCEVLAEKTGLKHLSVNQVVKERECHEGWDDEYQSWIVDEDKVGAPRRASRARARTSCRAADEIHCSFWTPSRRSARPAGA